MIDHVIPITWPDFAQEFFTDSPVFYHRLREMEQKRKIKLLGPAWNDPDEINFYARLTEMRFGIFFDSFVEEIYYEQTIGGKKPDWMIRSHEQLVIAEVLRLNAKESETRAYLQENKEIREFQKTHPGAPLVVASRAKILDSSYFYNSQGKIEAKVKKYLPIIRASQLPMILCVGSSLLTYINEDDAFGFFIRRDQRGYFFQPGDQQYIAGILLTTYFGCTYFFVNNNAKYPLHSGIIGELKALTENYIQR